LSTRPRPTLRSPLASEQEAREVAEAAREKDWQAPSFVRELFEGSFRLDLVHPFPVPDPADLERARPLMERLERFMRERVDSDRIDREGKIPEDVVRGLGEIGAFGLKIPTEYGGLGLSQYSYTHAIGLVTSQDGNLTALLSAAQSIGVPTPLKMFGTPEQKQRYLPRLARGAVSAFALTEITWAPTGARHPRRSMTASLRDQRRKALVHQRHHCGALVVMARTGPMMAAFIEVNWPGAGGPATPFRGLKAIENGIIPVQ
jgi:alkylation response protein AidB-like acyl-CoA dehydrogenase